MKDLDALRVINKLKSVYRLNSVDERKESAAEHSWSSLIITEFFLDKVKQPLNRLRVVELTMYHDMTEIETGDHPVSPEHGLKDEQEEQAALLLKEKLPKQVGEKFFEAFTEYFEQKTIEARFVRAIDSIDPMIHELDYKEDWKGWTKEFLITKKRKYFEEFPEILAFFDELLDHMEEEGYFKNH